MKPTKLSDIILLIFCVTSFLALALTLPNLKQASAEGISVTSNDEFYRMLQNDVSLRRAHTIMQKQNDRLLNLLRSFLMGDTESIQKLSSEIEIDMNQLVMTHFPDKNDQADFWNNISRYSKEIVELKKHLARGDYNMAYRAFSNIGASCIRCHQAAREWGKFSTSKAQEVNTDSQDK